MVINVVFFSVAVRFAKQLNLPNAHVMKYSGFKKTDEYDLKDNEVVRKGDQSKEVPTEVSE